MSDTEQDEVLAGGALLPFWASEKTYRFLRGFLVVLSVGIVLLFVISVKLRLHYSFNYNDSGMLSSVLRVRAGLPLYSTPTIDFTPFLYTPIFYYTAAMMTRLVGPNYDALRLLSAFATLGCFVVIYALVYGEVRRHFAAIAAVGCFASCYAFVLEWFDVGRVDMLHLFFVLCAFYATRRMNPIIAALLWLCAFQTKQGVLPIALLALCHDVQRPRRIALGVVSFVLALGASIAWLTYITGGWYRFYVFGVVGGFGYDMHLLPRYIPTDLFMTFGIAILIVTAAFIFTAPKLRSSATLFYLAGTLGMVIFTGYVRAHRGAGINAVLPAYLWIAILFGISLGRLTVVMESRTDRITRASLGILMAAACVQLSSHLYSPREFSPKEAEIAKLQGVIDQIRSIPGDVLDITIPEEAMLAGKPMHAQLDAAGAVIEAQNHINGDRLIAQYASAIHATRFSAIVLAAPAEQYTILHRVWMPSDFLAFYPLRVAASGSDLILTGIHSTWIYLPCRSLDAAKSLDPQVDVSPCRTAPHP